MANTRRQVLQTARQREADELARLHSDFRWHADYRLAVAWREKRIANLDWHLSLI
jgi:hypothetical protein